MDIGPGRECSSRVGRTPVHNDDDSAALLGQVAPDDHDMSATEVRRVHGTPQGDCAGYSVCGVCDVCVKSAAGEQRK